MNAVAEVAQHPAAANEGQAPDKPRRGRPPKGRIDKGTGAEAVINLTVLQEKLGYLERCYREAAEAKQVFSEAVKVTAEQSGLLSVTVARFVRAKCGNRYAEARKAATQLEFVFEKFAGQ